MVRLALDVCVLGAKLARWEVASFTAPPENDACTPTSNPPKLGCSLPVNIDPQCDCETNTVDGKTYGSVDVSDSTLVRLWAKFSRSPQHHDSC